MQDAFGDFRKRKSENTLRRHKGDLALFSQYLATVGASGVDLWGNPEAWRLVTGELLAGFREWMLNQGYAAESVNVRLFTARVHSRLAMSAGIISPGEFALISAVRGYSKAESVRVDEKRRAAGIPTRRGAKKSKPVIISRDGAKALKNQSGSPAACRNVLIMCLLLDHGLRVGEVARLLVEEFDLESGLLHFYRPKVNRTQIHSLSEDTKKAARVYIRNYAPRSGSLWRKGNRVGDLYGEGLTEYSITMIVNRLGNQAGICGLSAHDCRHYWATQAARNKTPLDRLQDAGGWSSPYMPLHYIEAEKIANEGVILEVSG